MDIGNQKAEGIQVDIDGNRVRSLVRIEPVITEFGASFPGDLEMKR